MEFSINARKRPKQNPKALPQRIDSQCSSSASLISLSSVESTGDDLKGKDEENATTLVSLIASMSKSLMGAGGLSLSNGIAQSGNAPEAMFAAILWICLLAVVFGFFCWLIAYLCEITKSTTYRGLWQSTVGHKGGLSVSLANTFKAALSNLAYATILSDTLQSLLLSAGYHVPRWVCLSFITFFGILPLCMLENLNWLAPFSIVGSAGIVFTAASMGIRYFDGSYREGGVFWEEIPTDQKPQFGSVNRSWSWAILPYVCMIYEAFVMHYNSARFYTSLRKRSLSKFAVATGCSFGLATLVYMALAGYGFLTFGAASKDFILNNYSPNDKLIMISRLAVGISTLVSIEREPILYHIIVATKRLVSISNEVIFFNTGILSHCLYGSARWLHRYVEHVRRSTNLWTTQNLQTTDIGFVNTHQYICNRIGID